MRLMQEERMEIVRTWLRLTRAGGDDGERRQYLREKGYSEEELSEIFRWEAEDAQTYQLPLF